MDKEKDDNNQNFKQGLAKRNERGLTKVGDSYKVKESKSNKKMEKEGIIGNRKDRKPGIKS